MGRIFGGFTDISWKKKYSDYKEGNANSFIFSLKDDLKFVKLMNYMFKQKQRNLFFIRRYPIWKRGNLYK